MKIFGREPTLYVTFIGAVLSYIVTLNIDGLSDLQAASIMGALTALTGVLNGFMVKPFNPAFLNGLIAAGAGVLIAYGFDVSNAQVAGIQAIAVAAGGLWAVRDQVTPNADPENLMPAAGKIK